MRSAAPFLAVVIAASHVHAAHHVAIVEHHDALVPSHAAAQSTLRGLKNVDEQSLAVASSSRTFGHPTASTKHTTNHMQELQDGFAPPTPEEIEAARYSPYAWMRLHLEYVAFFIAAPLTAYACALIWYFCCQAQRPVAVADSDRITGDFSDGLCECHHNLTICACACCCSCIRWPQTIDSAALGLPFWLGALLFVVLQSQLPFGFGAAGLLLVGLCVYYRWQLRQKYEMKGEPCGSDCTILKDIAIYLCCMPCAIAQEARHVEACEHAQSPTAAMARVSAPPPPEV